MSREGAPTKREQTAPPAGTPIWVWVVYALGLLAAAVLAGSALFALGAYLASDEDIAISWDISLPALLAWGGLTVAAAVLWLWRRGGGGR